MTLFHKPNSNKNKEIINSNYNSIILKLHEGKIYNFNDNICNVVNIYLRGSCDTSNSEKPGFYIALISESNQNCILRNNAVNTSANRMLLIGLIECIKVLNKPCLIKLYSHTHLGFSGGNINSDLKDMLFTLIKDNNHAIVETITDEKQEYLKSLHTDN